MNTRLFKNLRNPQDWLSAPIIVCRNYLRKKLNYYKIHFYANSNNKTVFLCKAEDKVIKKGCDNTLNKRVKSIIRLSEEKDTKNLMTNLPLVFGGKYFITRIFFM